MKVFLCWGGDQSKAIAAQLNAWLPLVLQSIQPFFSVEIEKGVKWANELDVALEGTDIGIVCLTQDNLQNPWVHFEAGALSKTAPSRVWTFLFDLVPSDVGSPLGGFQHTEATKEDVRRLLDSLYEKAKALGSVPDHSTLDQTYEVFWPKLDDAFKQIRIDYKDKTASQRKTGDKNDDGILEEILETVREQLRADTQARITNDNRWEEFNNIFALLKASPIKSEYAAQPRLNLRRAHVILKAEEFIDNGLLEEGEIEQFRDEFTRKLDDVLFSIVGVNYALTEQYDNDNPSVRIDFLEPIPVDKANIIRKELAGESLSTIKRVEFVPSSDNIPF